MSVIVAVIVGGTALNRGNASSLATTRLERDQLSLVRYVNERNRLDASPADAARLSERRWASATILRALPGSLPAAARSNKFIRHSASPFSRMPAFEVMVPPETLASMRRCRTVSRV